MWSGRQVDFVVNNLTEEQKNFLIREGKPLYDTVLEIIKIGQSLKGIDEIIESESRQLISKYENQIDGDYLKIDALVCFNAAFKKEIQPRINRRKVLTFGTVAFAEFLFRNKAIKSQHTNKTIKPKISEEEIHSQLNLAYEYRLKCDFYKCHLILNDIERRLKNDSSMSAKRLLATLYDLRVEAFHTTSERNFQKAANKTASQSISLWYDIRNGNELIHAFLRKAVLYRQQYYFNYSKLSLIKVVETLRDAEDEGIIRLAYIEGKNNPVTHESVCKFYTDTIKGYAQIMEFSTAKKYIEIAEIKCSEVGGYGSRNWLDLVRAKAVYIAERLHNRPYPRDFVLLDDTIEQMKIAIQIARSEYPKDLVLQQVLERDLIPLLFLTQASTYKEEADYYYRKSYRNAKILNLHHELRVIEDVKRRFSN